MKWLIKLYPEKWRDRYGEEFLYILENRKLTFLEVVDIVINALDTRTLILAEGLINMDKKIRDFMSESYWKRFLIFGIVIFVGLVGGYGVAQNTPSILTLSPRLLLLVGVGMGIFIGYVMGVIRGIMRVINVTQKEDVVLPTGKLKFNKIDS